MQVINFCFSCSGNFEIDALSEDYILKHFHQVVLLFDYVMFIATHAYM